MPKLLVADNYPLSRIGLCTSIQAHIPNVELTETSCSIEIMDLLAKNDYHLLILAVSQPGNNNIDLIKKIKLEKPKISILLMCIYPESIYGYRALSVGASGYVNRETPINDVITAVKNILKGESYITSTLAKNIITRINKRSKTRSIELLSNRELQILQLMAAGKKPNRIAAETNLSLSTIGTYRQRIFSKLDMRTDAELTRFAIDNSLV
jgi:two-component system invasion response regulator UvrY